MRAYHPLSAEGNSEDGRLDCDICRLDKWIHMLQTGFRKILSYIDWVLVTAEDGFTFYFLEYTCCNLWSVAEELKISFFFLFVLYSSAYPVTFGFWNR